MVASINLDGHKAHNIRGNKMWGETVDIYNNEEYPEGSVCSREALQ